MPSLFAKEKSVTICSKSIANTADLFTHPLSRTVQQPDDREKGSGGMVGEKNGDYKVLHYN